MSANKNSVESRVRDLMKCLVNTENLRKHSYECRKEVERSFILN